MSITNSKNVWKPGKSFNFPCSLEGKNRYILSMAGYVLILSWFIQNMSMVIFVCLIYCLEQEQNIVL